MKPAVMGRRVFDRSCNDTEMSKLGQWHLDQTRVLEPVATTPRTTRAALLVVMVALVVVVLAAWAVAS